jgi:hypothetical protein
MVERLKELIPQHMFEIPTRRRWRKDHRAGTVKALRKV